jgi:hypothetical protein
MFSLRSRAQNKGRYRVSPGRPIPIPDFDEPQPDMVLFQERRTHRQPPFANDMVSTTEDEDKGFSFGIREEFTCVVLLSALIAAKGRIGL